VVPGSSYQLRFLTIVCLSEIFISLFVFIGPEILGSGQLEQFQFECQKVIGFVSLCYTIDLKTLHHSFILSEVKPCLLLFSRTLHHLIFLITITDI